MVMDFVLFDWRLQAEQQKRRFVPLTFEPPPETVPQVTVLPPATSVEGDPLGVDVMSCGGERPEELTVRLSTAEGGPATEPFSATVPIRPGAGGQTVVVGSVPAPGKYLMTSRMRDVAVESELITGRCGSETATAFRKPMAKRRADLQREVKPVRTVVGEV